MSHTYTGCHHLVDVKVRMCEIRTRLSSPSSPGTADCQLSRVFVLRDDTHSFQDPQIPQIVDKYVASPHRPDGV